MYCRHCCTMEAKRRDQEHGGMKGVRMVRAYLVFHTFIPSSPPYSASCCISTMINISHQVELILLHNSWRTIENTVFSSHLFSLSTQGGQFTRDVHTWLVPRVRMSRPHHLLCRWHVSRKTPWGPQGLRVNLRVSLLPSHPFLLTFIPPSTPGVPATANHLPEQAAVSILCNAQSLGCARVPCTCDSARERVEGWELVEDG